MTIDLSNIVFSTYIRSVICYIYHQRPEVRVILKYSTYASIVSDCVTMEPPDTVLLKPPSLSLLARLSSDQSLPQTGQRFQFSKVNLTFHSVSAAEGPDCEAGILPRSLHVIFSSIHDHVFQGLGVKPHRCREFTVLNQEQQAEEALFKKNLLKQFKENEKSNISVLNMTNQTLLEGSTMMGTNAAAEDEISLKFKPNTKFSVWVSFCEIYNENIHDLLEVAPSGAPRRAALRLSQDVKGNAFVKGQTDLRWVQVNSAEEAYKVVKLGRRNQSFSSTRLNQLSSRRLLQHVPFRESKLTHYLQGFFCGRGRACMIVNINQCASMYDETLNVLKFSAVAQKVVVLISRPIPIIPQASCSDSSFSRTSGRKTVTSSSSSSLTGWETSLEDVQNIQTFPKENPPDGFLDEVGNMFTFFGCVLVRITVIQNSSFLFSTVIPAAGSRGADEARQVALLKELQLHLKKERAENLLLETQVREEVSREFSELFSNMRRDYE
ncbi:hypothetical protein XENOCAPTIV_014687 [Xenoophorus captivus]|uniref:Kinesin motor domain-containing protein n=1 Tax=Xenoophorus captivus TaxID=1517983 RepID=A0ABV0RQR9_9TELE